MQYIPPSQKLFNARHRITRKDLNENYNYLLDEDIDCSLYGVPLIDGRKRTNSISESDTSSIFSDLSKNSSIDVCNRLQDNLSTDYAIQDIKRKISKEEETLILLEQKGGRRAEAKRELQRLKNENRSLLKRKDLLTRRWDRIRFSPHLLMEARKDSLYWFGLPSDLREDIYKCCLTSTTVPWPVIGSLDNRLLNGLKSCVPNDESLAVQIFANLKKRQFLSSHVVIAKAKLESKFPGLYFHLRNTLKLNIFEDFAKPLIFHSLSYALEQRAADGVALELLDIFIMSMPSQELDTILLDFFFVLVLAQTHYKFFANELALVKRQIIEVKFDLVELLESMRQGRAGSLEGETST